ncbi:MAG: gamma-glutamylcyclotransferase [Nitrososphaeria archaeon]|nr:gamma-glutamylcyclotransferase [Nitrososphaeria archaeon]
MHFSRRVHAILEDWKLVFNKISNHNPSEGFANIVPCKGSSVEGILYEINSFQINRLDVYEGYPEHYYRINFIVKLDNGQQVKAVTYVANPAKTKDGLKPSKAYLGHLLKGCDLIKGIF